MNNTDKPFIDLQDMIVEFIARRFRNSELNWNSGNCYYFSIILKERFPNGKIYYDTIDGHFLYKYNHHFYDNNFPYKHRVNKRLLNNTIIEWDRFDDYDPIQKQRIIRDCLM